MKAYDVYAPSLEAAVKAGAEPCSTPAQAGEVDILGLMVVNALQVEDALFGAGQVAACKLPMVFRVNLHRADGVSSARECCYPVFLDCAAFILGYSSTSIGCSRQKHWCRSHLTAERQLVPISAIKAVTYLI